MTDKRTPLRHKKRISVRFGIDIASRVAFTEDISVAGMFLRSLNVCPPNTRIMIELSPDDIHSVVLEARVMWAKKVPQNLFHLVRKSGMGVRILRFHAGEAHYRRYCDEMGQLGSIRENCPAQDQSYVTNP